jgi:hypothetical protein
MGRPRVNVECSPTFEEVLTLSEPPQSKALPFQTIGFAYGPHCAPSLPWQEAVPAASLVGSLRRDALPAWRPHLSGPARGSWGLSHTRLCWDFSRPEHLSCIGPEWVTVVSRARRTSRCGEIGPSYLERSRASPISAVHCTFFRRNQWNGPNETAMFLSRRSLNQLPAFLGGARGGLGTLAGQQIGALVRQGT